MRRLIIPIAILAFIALTLVGVAFVVLTPSANAAGMMGVGRLMAPSPTGGSSSGFAILTEAGSIITTESGDPLRTE